MAKRTQSNILVSFRPGQLRGDGVGPLVVTAPSSKFRRIFLTLSVGFSSPADARCAGQEAVRVSARLVAGSVLQCLGQVRATNGVGRLKIRQCTCDLQDPMRSA